MLFDDRTPRRRVTVDDNTPVFLDLIAYGLGAATTNDPRCRTARFGITRNAGTRSIWIRGNRQRQPDDIRRELRDCVRHRLGRTVRP